MPLRDGDVEILNIQDRSLPSPSGKPLIAKEITFRVRGGSEERVYVPRDIYTKALGEQAVLKAASEIVDLYDAYPVKE